jgi:hypothetical protein
MTARSKSTEKANANAIRARMTKIAFHCPDQSGDVCNDEANKNGEACQRYKACTNVYTDRQAHSTKDGGTDKHVKWPKRVLIKSMPAGVVHKPAYCSTGDGRDARLCQMLQKQFTKAPVIRGDLAWLMQNTPKPDNK